jgi:hypothetical protein
MTPKPAEGNRVIGRDELPGKKNKIKSMLSSQLADMGKRQEQYVKTREFHLQRDLFCNKSLFVKRIQQPKDLLISSGFQTLRKTPRIQVYPGKHSLLRIYPIT